MCHFGRKILFDGYLMIKSNKAYKALAIKAFLFDDHLIKQKL
jgi:hypothetical protein